ncbi:histidine kinase [Leucobacter sp. UT-8R-CII-1-4]|uniref:histidine kinase n=1 Tax=Leucobacter sp. UT-8R-CII-1-4 TaxID=3040075 RepID=UPI0024A94943|nr:histidine kinase [Leucobacter sp. UT-8R-CII-1-4]MDI6023164.1 histidine kinase [Leucobacter sp. UT-8R-CII-1-4]
MIRRSISRLNANPRGRDTVIAVFWLIAGLALLQLGAYPLWPPLAVFHTSGTAFLLILLALAAVTTQRSQRPFLALALGMPLILADVLFGGTLGAILILTDLLYCAVKYGSARGVRILLWLIFGFIVTMFGTVLIWFRTEAVAYVVVVQWTLFLLVATLWGWNVRSERLRISAALAEQHAQSTQQMRQRIAHDLHDLVANQIAVSGLHVEAAKLQLAAAAESLPSGVPALSESLDQAALGAAQADAQLRRLIQVLKAVDDLNEQPEVPTEQLINETLGELDRQLPGARQLRWADEGKPGLYALLTRLPAANTRVALRVIQELIANAVKHGSGDIELSAQKNRVSVKNAYSPGTSHTRGSGIGINGADMLLEGTGMSLESRASEAENWLAELTLETERS